MAPGFFHKNSVPEDPREMPVKIITAHNIKTVNAEHIHKPMHFAIDPEPRVTDVYHCQSAAADCSYKGANPKKVQNVGKCLLHWNGFVASHEEINKL